MLALDTKTGVLNAVMDFETEDDHEEHGEREPFGTPRFWFLALLSLGKRKLRL